MNEFDIINHFFHKKLKHPEINILGSGDDAAITQIPTGYQLVSTIDTSVSGVHFHENTAAYDIAYKSTAVSFSDLAAMGAKPISLLMSITMPTSDHDWLTKFSRGLFTILDQFDVDLIGGDLTRGPLSISTIAYGLIPSGKSIRRSGAQVGDSIFVTGMLGDAGLALQLLEEKKQVPPEILKALNQPYPQVKLGLALREFMSSCIDISDGLSGDLKHILDASKVGAEIYIDELPLSKQLLETAKDPYPFALTSGDDYQLCFTVSQANKANALACCKRLNQKITEIGRIVEKPGLNAYGTDGNPVTLNSKSYDHFRN